ncbi:hypothetical protein PV797_20105 [Clostridiaceae bacterium M8S5]|nr:hypothetical protein PV797_20105 [Clostridiaceae bacterium M8S5]
MENWLEWLGYLASLIVLISLLMSSILKLRWINLIGALLFSLYGFLINALPVGFMNLGIAFINIYYLFKIYRSKEYFKILPIENDSLYFKNFLNFYKDDIEKYSETKIDIDNSDISFYILRNMIHAGLFIGSRYNNNTLRVNLDFVVPEYRDFKIASFIFGQNRDYFVKKGYSKLICFSTENEHTKYLTKMGFEKSSIDGKQCFLKTI